MPNWCSNVLTVKPNEDFINSSELNEKKSIGTLKLFKSQARGGGENLKLNNLYPMPSNLENEGWYEWRISNWSTKWDVENANLEQMGDDLIYQFETAWAPPENWLIKISEDYPELEFHMEFEEPGVGLFGGILVINGEVVDEWENEDPWENEDDDDGSWDEPDPDNTNPGGAEGTSTDLTPQEAYEILQDGGAVMVKGWGGQEDMYAEVSIDDFEGETRGQIITSLGDYDSLQVWH